MKLDWNTLSLDQLSRCWDLGMWCEGLRMTRSAEEGERAENREQSLE